MKKQFVYVMQSDSGLVKIGIAAEPEKRRATLERASGHAVQIVVVRGPFNRASAVERSAHALLANCRQAGEWFRCQSETAVAAVDSALVGFDDAEECAEDSAAMEDVAAWAASGLTDPAARMLDLAKELMGRLERKSAEYIALTEKFVEATELLDLYANHAKEMAEIARCAVEKVRRLEDERARMQPSLLAN